MMYIYTHAHTQVHSTMVWCSINLFFFFFFILNSQYTNEIAAHVCVCARACFWIQNHLWKVWKISSSDELSCCFQSDKFEFILKCMQRHEHSSHQCTACENGTLDARFLAAAAARCCGCCCCTRTLVAILKFVLISFIRLWSFTVSSVFFASSSRALIVYLLFAWCSVALIVENDDHRRKI